VTLRETFTGQLCLLALFSEKIDFDLNFNFLANTLLPCEEKSSFIKFVYQGKDEVQNVFVKSFQSRSGLSVLLKMQCKMQKTNSIERKTGAERPQTARSEQQN